MINTRNERNSHPRKRLLPALSAFAVFFSSLNGRNAPVTIAAGEDQIVRISRRSRRSNSPQAERISYLQAGEADGRRVILIHGTPGKARGWTDYLLDVPPGHTYIALDRPGYGESEPEHAVIALQRQAQAIAPFLETSGGKRTILVGHSSGAAMALQAALDYPDRVGGMLLLAGAFDPELEEAVWLQHIGMFRPVSRLLPRAINNANHELLYLKRGLLAQADRLQLISIPVEVVHGNRDPLVPVANVAYLQRTLVNASLKTLVLEGADHYLPWHSKPVVDAALKRLIDRVGIAEL